MTVPHEVEAYRVRSAIRDVIALNALLVDQLRFDEWAMLYCPDGVHESRGVRSEGREELRRYIEAAVPAEGLVHLCGRSVVELPSPTRATATTSWISVRVSGSQVELAFAGRYSDCLEETEDGWRFAYRRNDLLER
jgi:SnoaL-like protein